jgi:hypothetical protein
MPGAAFMTNEPNLTLSLDDDCRTQVRVGVETRTTPYHIRTGEYQDEQLSVYVTARRYGSLEPGKTFVSALDDLAKVLWDTLDNYVVKSVLEPLARTIAMD